MMNGIFKFYQVLLMIIQTDWLPSTYACYCLENGRSFEEYHDEYLHLHLV